MYRPMYGNLTNLQVLIGVLISEKKLVQLVPHKLFFIRAQSLSKARLLNLVVTRFELLNCM